MATPIAIVAVPLVGLFFTFLPFAIYVKLSKNVSEAVKWILFVTIWIAFEALYTYNDISFPWLTLGHAFDAQIVQWYSFTGVFGGTLWVLLANIFGFKMMEKAVFICDNRSRIGAILRSPYFFLFVATIVIPLIISGIMFSTYKEEHRPVNVAVLQPNIDPYTEKFGSMSNQQQLNIILDLAGNAPKETQFFVAPETAIEDNLRLDNLSSNSSLSQIRSFLSNSYPSATFVTGATTLRIMNPFEEDYNSYLSGSTRYQIYNSALWVDTTVNIDVYHKAKLVCGVETIPYPTVFQALDNVLNVDLGGLGGKNGKSTERAAYKDAGTAICYEAIYGEFYSEYVKKGAQFMFVISNDGWWGDTQGHRHLVKYSAHRAVETRRSIARSANTGISAIINQRGEVEQKLGWDERGLITGQINANDKITFYVKNGDFIVRLSLYLLALTLVYMVGLKFYKKNNSNR